MAVSIIGNRQVVFPLHDTNAIAGEPAGFIPDATGTFEGRLFYDDADSTFVVNAGQLYPGRLLYARSTGALTVTSLQIWYGKYA